MRMDGDQVALADHAVDLGVDGTYLREEDPGRCQAIGCLRVVIDEVPGQDVAECRHVTGPEHVVEPADDRLVHFALMLDHFAAFL